jgi:hypothetical protein
VTATLMAETFDPLEPAGAAELYRRLEAAEPRRVPRRELDGHVGLTSRELYELGCTLEPLTVTRLGGMFWWRLLTVAGILLATIGVAGAVIGVVDALGIDRGDDDPLTAASGVAAAALFLSAAWGGLALMRRGIRAVRRLAAERRRAAGHTARRASNDPHGRATVGMLRGPGVLRVQLLWVRGDARDAACVEVRTLAEQRIDEDDAGRAEDAVAAMSEIALRADNAHTLRREGALRLHRRRTAERRSDPTPRRRADPLLRAVDGAWRPEPLTDAGQAELAHRLVTADPERWSAAVLEPLLVTGAMDATHPGAPWPEQRQSAPKVAAIDKPSRWIFWISVLTFFTATSYLDDPSVPAGASAVAVGAAVAAILAAAVPKVLAWRRPGRRLRRAVRAAASSPPLALEQGLPGAAGRFAVARGQGRLALLHVRPAPDDGRRGELEVRTLATREGDDPDSVTTFCAIAGEARLRTESAGRSAHYVRTLMARLGRVPARIGEPALWREPLAWAAGAGIAVLVAASIKHMIVGTWLEDGLLSRVISYTWVLIASYLALRAARRVRDPFAL